MKDDGVSPILGVGVMIALTIVLVIVVSVFAFNVINTDSDPVMADITYIQTTSNGDFQYQMNSGASFYINKIEVSYTLDRYPDFGKIISFEENERIIDIGSRFTAGNLNEFKEDSVFQQALLENKSLYLDYLFVDAGAGTVVSSGTIVVPGDME